MRLFMICWIVFFSHASAVKRNLEWWTSTDIYDIYIPSYKDSNNDGIGDINGLTSKLPYLKELGIRTIKLSSIFETAEMNTFYREGVTNYKEIHPLLGTMQDFETFLGKAEKEGMKVVINLPISRCHQSHEWFQKSRRSVKPYKYYFIWRRGNTSKVNPQPPNLWTDESDNLVWTMDEERKKFYYHSYHYSLPDLNLKNKKVKEEIKDIMNFWLNKGVAGFNLLAAYSYMKPSFSKKEKDKSRAHKYVEASLYYDQPATFPFLKGLRKIVDEFSEMHSDYQRIIMVEDRSDDTTTIKYFGDEKTPLAHIISNQHFSRVDDYFFTLDELNALINPVIEQYKRGRYFEWVSDCPMASRLAGQRYTGKQLSELILILTATLPGILRIYYGQEIGMKDPTHYDYAKKPGTNLHALAMQWDDSKFAGFTSKSDPFVRPSPDYWSVNVEQQRRDNSSMYQTTRNLLTLRKTETFKYGDFQLRTLSKNIYAFTRSFGRHETYLTIINLSNEAQIITSLRSTFKDLPETMLVVVASTNSLQQKGYKLKVSSTLVLRPLSALVVEFINEETISTSD